MSGSAAGADSRLRQACGRRARRSVLQRTSSSTPQSFTAPRARLARDYALSRRTVMKSAGCSAAEKGPQLRSQSRASLRRTAHGERAVPTTRGWAGEAEILALRA